MGFRLGLRNQNPNPDNNDVFSKRILDLDSRLNQIEARVKGYNRFLDNLYDRVIKLEKRDPLDVLVDRVSREPSVERIVRRITALDLMIENGELAGIDNRKLQELMEERQKLKQELKKTILHALLDTIILRLFSR